MTPMETCGSIKMKSNKTKNTKKNKKLCIYIIYGWLSNYGYG